MTQWMQEQVEESDFVMQRFTRMNQGRLVFMVEPDGFDVVAAINPHMLTAEGRLQRVDRVKARLQWQTLHDSYQALGLEVSVLRAQPQCPDMVFCANQTFPFIDHDGAPAVVLSNMANPLRHEEVEILALQLEARGVRSYKLASRSPQTFFEGMGDALWVPGRRLICGGYGIRTQLGMYKRLQEITQAPIVLFELKHPKFYHLDTCLSILDEESALACRAGYTDEGWRILQGMFPRLIEVPLVEADSPGFACNAHCPDQKHVLIQQGNPQTVAALEAQGFIPIEIDTSEFIKSGGSVFCMKLQSLWDHWPIPS